MGYGAREQSVAWVEMDYKYHSTDSHFPWKLKWRLECWGALRMMGEAVLCPALCDGHVFVHIEIRKHFNTKSVSSRLSLSTVFVSTSTYKTLTSMRSWRLESVLRQSCKESLNFLGQLCANIRIHGSWYFGRNWRECYGSFLKLKQHSNLGSVIIG